MAAAVFVIHIGVSEEGDVYDHSFVGLAKGMALFSYFHEHLVFSQGLLKILTSKEGHLKGLTAEIC